jgi:hypothetical protein
MLAIMFAYIIWIVPSHPEFVAYKYKKDCEQSRLIDRRQVPVSVCFAKKMK